MKKIKRSLDVLLFLVIFIVIINNLNIKINKNDVLNYVSNISYNKYKSSNNLITKDNLPLMLNYYTYNNYKDIEVLKEEKPKVYIFNTHYEEEYSDTNVIEMSKLLNEKLRENNINSIFEDTNYKEYIKINDLIGVNNYIMIRPIIEEKIDEEMKLVIDLHRDSINKKDSIININGKEYAKVLFVVDNYYKDYLIKYDLANKYNNYLNSKYKGISRGVYVKNGKGFNQDLSKNMILLELGGYQNSKEELINTIDVIVQMIKEFIYD